MPQNHEIDYRIFGEEMQIVEIELDPQETVIAESGSFMMMDQEIQMQTMFGDGSQANQGFLGKLMSAGKGCSPAKASLLPPSLMPVMAKTRQLRFSLSW
ncbi:AIM24 family protein [Chitinophaga sedimenti]|uniref:AIM24 family protein n=1 Tax=Chitinophaga sedimenti TaxID=2033606 RepID=UPI003558FC47